MTEHTDNLIRSLERNLNEFMNSEPKPKPYIFYPSIEHNCLIAHLERKLTEFHTAQINALFAAGLLTRKEKELIFVGKAKKLTVEIVEMEQDETMS